MAVLLDAEADSVILADGRFSTAYRHVRAVANPADGMFKFATGAVMKVDNQPGVSGNAGFTWRWVLGSVDYNAIHATNITIANTAVDMAL